jgi:hypothetical protein
MEIVAALKELGFNFWQVVIVIGLLLFRVDIRQILERIKSLKVGENEISLMDVGFVNDIRKIEDEAAANKNTTVEELRDELSVVLRRRCVGALLNIRSLTAVLWPYLKNLMPHQAALTVDIRLETYKEIEPNLRLLEAAGMFEYSTLPVGKAEGVQKLTLLNIHPHLRELIQEAEHF